MIDYNDLGSLAVFSATAETKLRKGKCKTIDELSSLYKGYMELRLDTLHLKNKVFGEGSLKAYDCALELIIGIIGYLDRLDGDTKSKKSLKETLQKDYKRVKEMKENFRKRLEAYV